SRHHHDLPSFPTRRSSDLEAFLVLTLTQLAERVTRDLATDIGGAPVEGTVGVDGVLSLHGESESTDRGVTYVSFRVENWEATMRSEEHTSELQSRFDLVCR